MAKPKIGTVGAALETTIIFPPKSLVEDLAKAKRDTKKRTQSANGTLGEKIGSAVEDKHLDRKAFSMACQLDAMDDERLHITYHSLLKYCEDLGVTKRATAQEELFDSEASGDEPEGKMTGGGKDDGKVTPIGRGGRKVAETAGGDDAFKSTH